MPFTAAVEADAFAVIKVTGGKADSSLDGSKDVRVMGVPACWAYGRFATVHEG